jgi:hypothetical protein
MKKIMTVFPECGGTGARSWNRKWSVIQPGSFSPDGEDELLVDAVILILNIDMVVFVLYK